MRLFTAIELPDTCRDRLLAWQQALRPHAPTVRWTPRANLHLTLKFIGEVPDDQIAEVCAAMQALAPEGPMELATGGLLLLPPRSPRIVAAEVPDPGGTLARLFARIESALTPLGIPRERRPYLGHITLGRSRTGIGAPARLPGLLAPERVPAETFTVDRFALFESRLDGPVPTYVRLATWPV
jgi:2'-5' RNA ligase